MPKHIPGVEYDFGGGRVYTLAPLNIGTLMRLQGKLEALSSATSAVSPDVVNTILQATHASLLRNYPSITEADVADLVDVANMHDVIALVLDVGGFKRRAFDAATPAKNLPAQSLEPLAPAAGLPS